MHKLTCLIVEDEPLAAEGLESYIREIPFLEWVGTCHEAFSATTFLHKNKVDVLFLDIHLPKLKGLDFLRTLERPPQVILTTAYHEYALEGYELNVVDYLLKPFGMPRFLAAVNKLSFPSAATTSTVVSSEQGRGFHFFNENKRMVKVYFDEVTYIESLKEYIQIHLTENRTVTTRFQLGEFEQLTQGHSFLRIHRSFLVALDKIDVYSAASVTLNTKELPIGRAYREEVRQILSQYGGKGI